MMTGTVNRDLEARLPLALHDANGNQCVVDAMIDTGFNGYLTLPAHVIQSLNLPWLCRQEGELVDGTIVVLDVYVAMVEWHREPRSIEIEATDATPLLGMALLEGSELRIQVLDGGSATVVPIPKVAE